MDIIEVIRGRYCELTRKQKKIADYMLENMEKMSFITMKELSAETSVTEVTILNACNAMGFESFKEVKYEARKYLGLREKLTLHESGDYNSEYIPKHELNDKKNFLKKIWEEESALWEVYAQSVDFDEIFRIARELIAKKNIVLCGRGISKILAEFFCVRLSGCSMSSVIMDTELNDSIHAALPMIQSDTATVVISFPDYYFMTDKIAEYAKSQGSRVLVITDTRSAKIAGFADDILTVPSDTRLFLNTLSMPMGLVNILTSAIDIEKNNSGKENGVTEKFTSLFRAKQVVEAGNME